MGRMTRINQRSPSDMAEEIQTEKSGSSAPSGRLHPLVVRVWRDDSIPAFGAWCAGSLKDGNPAVLLNVEACLSPCVTEDGEEVKSSVEEKKWLMITTLLHEFGHALQEFFGMEFEEDRLERIVEEYEHQNGPVAQLVEAADLNSRVSGSTPDGATSHNTEASRDEGGKRP